ncbi:unnamed protein product [Mortierella alpina]
MFTPFSTKPFLLAWIALSLLNVVWSAPTSDNSTEAEDAPGRLYRWIAIACGAVINIFIGGYAGLTNILETEGRWTQRLEFVRDENKWWSGMSTIVLTAFAMDVAAFSKGESVDATILLLAAEVGIVVFVYVVQGTLHAEFRLIVWLAWTGNSRTGCDLLEGAKIGGILVSGRRGAQLVQRKPRYESKVEIPGYGAMFSPKIKQDLMTVLKQTPETERRTADEVFGFVEVNGIVKKFVYPQQELGQSKVSILWGGGSCELFSRRVSRGITGYTLDRIRSSYSLINVDEKKWMFVAGGIVSRNKGLYPWKLMCGLVEGAVFIDEVETTSKWRPRSAKTSRSQYLIESKAQFGGLGDGFCSAVVEIALLMQDVPNSMVIRALRGNVEQQPSEKLWRIQELFEGMELQRAMYESQYMTLCAKFNWYSKTNDERPDLLMGMMYATHKNWSYTLGGDEQGVREIVERELAGLLDHPFTIKSHLDTLINLGAYLGIPKGNRREVISRVRSKFAEEGALWTMFSEEFMEPVEEKSEKPEIPQRPESSIVDLE